MGIMTCHHFRVDPKISFLELRGWLTDQMGIPKILADGNYSWFLYSSLLFSCADDEDGHIIKFYFEDDAMLFKLAWIDYIKGYRVV